MKKIPLFALILTALAVGLFTLPLTLQAQEDPKFPNVEMFTTASGQLGFFNKEDGKIYIYNIDSNKCTYQGQIESLGDPITGSQQFSEKPSLEATPRKKR